MSSRRSGKFITILCLSLAATALAEPKLFTNGHLVTMLDDQVTVQELLVKDGRIIAVGPNLSREGVTIVDMQGRWSESRWTARL